MNNFTWVEIYNKIAHKIMEYKEKPKEFVDLMYKCLEEAGVMNSEMKGSNLDRDGDKRCRYEEIDPISFMNRFDMYSDNNRKKLIEVFERNTGMNIEIPKDFNGIPSTNPQASCVIRFKDEREKDDVKNIWDLFEIALEGNPNNKERFINAYDKVLSKPYAKYNISMGLFKIRPDIYINLDMTNRKFIEKKIGIEIKSCPSGKKYLEIIDNVKNYISNSSEYSNMLEFSYDAWKNRKENEIKYWIYAPGGNACLWEECYKKGIMVLGWDQIGDYNQYKSKKEISEVLKKNDRGEKPTNQTLAIIDFKDNISIGDIIIVKDGVQKILGYGEVISDYYYDDSRKMYKNVRQVDWKLTGEWKVEKYEEFKQLPRKTLTEITNIKNKNIATKLMEMMENKMIIENKNYFWLNANPKIWSFSEIGIGEFIIYTATNENGNKRRIYKNFVNAQKGDLVIAYESHPTKKIVGLCVVEDKLNENGLKIKKVEDLVNPIDYAEIKNIKELENMEYFKNQQGSLFKLTKEEYEVLLDLIRESNPIKKVEKNEENTYSREIFKKEVYISEVDYDNLEKLLLRKKNIILQGPPGVGKTFMAKRLAYSILGYKDETKIKTVQFHQNYSYEDFIEGWRPVEEGFKIEEGIFYKFCKEARNNPDDKYFFIIDEINRGNLSKIFGELLMLIENDKRGEKLTLTYSKTEFSVPDNLYIIGMMNTADRSLAMLDYALRRRFSFYDVEPAFENNTFKEYQKSCKNEYLDKIINKIKDLNSEIEKDVSLGKGFKIGHSYFCGLEKSSQDDIYLIIKYEIIPMIEEYWFDNEEKIEKWKKILLEE